MSIPATPKVWPFAEPSAIPLSPTTGISDVKTNVFTKLDAAPVSVDLVAVLAHESASKGDSEKRPLFQIDDSHSAHTINQANSSILTEFIATEEFSGADGKSHLMRVAVTGTSWKHVALFGLGATRGDYSGAAFTCSKTGATLGGMTHQKKCQSVAVFLPNDLAEECVVAFFSAFFLDLSPDNRFKSGEKKFSILTNLTVVVDKGETKLLVERALAKSKKVALGVRFAQELVNAPANYCTPQTLADAAVVMAKEMNLKSNILDPNQIAALGMGSFLCVGKGSVNTPRLIHLTYTPTGSVKKRIAFVGKGITFDSGGYNLKVNGQIELMKFDMGGGAAVLGAARIVAALKPLNVEVHFIIPTAENMIDATAYRPGDILTASNGKTIEVGNTDAEGRLILADGLVYAEKLGVDTILDIATLTGACMVALGVKVGGVFSPNRKFAESICQIGETHGEPLWAMPLFPEYRKDLDSKAADMKNIGTRYGGSIVAAQFLKEFVSDKVQWAHIDIAGPAWDVKDGTPTGFGARTLANFVLLHSQ